MLFFLTFLSFFSTLSQATEPSLLFTCKSQHSIFDPSFSQGSEIYIKVYEQEKLISLISYPPSSPPVSLTQFSDTRTSFINLSQGTAVFDWLHKDFNPYFSMVYLGGSSWGGALHLDDTIKELDSSLKEFSHIELLCEEKSELISF